MDTGVMKIAHSVQVTPHRAGLYETARDLAEAEIKAGHEVWLIDPIKNKTGKDRGVPITSDLSHMKTADVIINHSGLNKEMSRIDRPIVHMLHGRPYSTFLLEQKGEIGIYSYWERIAKDDRFKAFVTFWPEYLPYFSAVLPEDKLHSITAPVNLERWTPDGPKGYDFHGMAGKVNIVCADMWRDDIDPYHVVHAFLYYARNIEPGARLHIYAQPNGGAWEVLKRALGDNLGECVGYIKGLENVYRAADVVISPHRIATRSVRESLACNTQLVKAPGYFEYSIYTADPEDTIEYAEAIDAAVKGIQWKENTNREIAEHSFDPKHTAKEFIRILDEVTHGID